VPDSSPIQLGRLRARLAERHITIEMTPDAQRYLVRAGYDSAYGARPLKRAIQKNVETRLGRLLMDGTVRDGQLVRIDYDRAAGTLVFSPQPIPAGKTQTAGS
jgi:ATP-dependent Clp protease ATP-binding subunit ClpB